ncbi:MAG: paraquat-inducible protein A [Pseudomonadota bacterium]|nr:paraquat-inducible protein A [Pseudomonadota bacterium]
MPAPIASARAWLGCDSCGLASSDRLGEGASPAYRQRCPRCGHPLLAVRDFSLQRTWACAIAAAVFYVPANLMPVMLTTSSLEHEEHTLLGGIRELWLDGSWGLAAIVFIASIAVPVLKIGALTLLAWTVRHAPQWRRLERARLYRMIETVGHWSMLDVYVVVLLAATIRFGSLASVSVGPGLLAFAAVVVLTMLATRFFDPRLIWHPELTDERRPA